MTGSRSSRIDRIRPDSIAAMVLLPVLLLVMSACDSGSGDSDGAGAGDPDSHVELIPGVGHTMQHQATPCGGGGTTSERYLELLDDWIEMLIGTA